MCLVFVVLRAVFAHACCFVGVEFEGKGRMWSLRHRDALWAFIGVDSDELVSPTLVRWLAVYLDVGLAYWLMPSRDLGFHRVVCEFARHGAAPGWRGAAFRELARQCECGMDAFEVIHDRLRALGVGPSEWAVYLEAELLALPGWAGMFHCLELRAEERMRTRSYRFDEFLAVRLTLSVAALAHELGRCRPTISLAELRDAACVEREGRGEFGWAY